ncbi:MAG TPA: sigma-70 family RNA polymerase sigma factor [Prolixibacteraceae bacterium]|nr:sigma-70 family RNA polymerase sigma factor [Prolixibacteraceae bacterium]
MTDSKEQFLIILEQNIGIIVKIARAYTKIEQDREDLINDITLELWKSFGRFNGESKISTWIYRVALNVSMNYKRKRTNTALFDSIQEIPKKDLRAWFFSEEDTSASEILYDCIGTLDDLNKAIILLYLDGNTHDEISAITGISKTNVGTKIGRIKEQLRDIITKEQ